MVGCPGGTRLAAIADVLVRRLSLGVLVCDRVRLNRRVGGFVVGVGDRLGLGHLARTGSECSPIRAVATQCDFLRGVVRSADRSLHLPDTAKK